MNNNPIVTVLMPVYNGEKYLREAINSILNQTFTDFEFLIVDDCSSDNSIKIIKGYSDPRIILLRNDENFGIAETANRGMKLAKGKYIIRIDCDDISLPQRIQMQVSFMERNPKVVICGSSVQCIGEHAVVWKMPKLDCEIRPHLLFGTAILQPTIIMRRDVIIREELFYDSRFIVASDYDLWSRIPKKYKLANLPEVLVKYRLHDTQISNIQKDAQRGIADIIRKRLIESLGVSFSIKEMNIHSSLVYFDFQINKKYINEVAAWSSKLLFAVKESNIYNYKVFEKQLLRIINTLFFRSLKLGPWIIKKYFYSPFSKDLLFISAFMCIPKKIFRNLRKYFL